MNSWITFYTKRTCIRTWLVHLSRITMMPFLFLVLIQCAQRLIQGNHLRFTWTLPKIRNFLELMPKTSFLCVCYNLIPCIRDTMEIQRKSDFMYGPNTHQAITNLSFITHTPTNLFDVHFKGSSGPICLIWVHHVLVMRISNEKGMPFPENRTEYIHKRVLQGWWKDRTSKPSGRCNISMQDSVCYCISQRCKMLLSNIDYKTTIKGSWPYACLNNVSLFFHRVRRMPKLTNTIDTFQNSFSHATWNITFAHQDPFQKMWF